MKLKFLSCDAAPKVGAIAVRALSALALLVLERSGQDGLPLILVDGAVALTGRYPSRAELARWAGIAISAGVAKQSGCCGGSGSC